MNNKRYILDEQTPQPQEGFLEGAARNIARGTVDLASTVGGLPRTIQDLSEGITNAVGLPKAPISRIPKLPAREDIRGYFEDIAEKNRGKGALKPHSRTEEALDRAVSFVPYLAMGGGSVPARLATAAAGVAGGEAAKAAGFEELGQGIGEIVGSLGLAAGKGVSGLRNVLKSADTLKKTSAHQAKKLSPNLSYQTQPLRNRIENLADEAIGSFSGGTRNKVREEVGDVLKKLYGGTVEDLMQANDSIKDILGGGKTSLRSEGARNLFKALQGEIRNEMSTGVAEKFPDFYKVYNTADSIDRAQNIKSSMDVLLKTKMFKKVPEILATPTAILLGSAWWGPSKIAPLAAAYGTIRAVDKGRMIKQMMSVPEIGQAVRALGDDILYGQPQFVLSKIKELDKLVRDNIGGGDKKSRYQLD